MLSMSLKKKLKSYQTKHKLVLKVCISYWMSNIGLKYIFLLFCTKLKKNTFNLPSCWWTDSFDCCWEGASVVDWVVADGASVATWAVSETAGAAGLSAGAVLQI